MPPSRAAHQTARLPESETEPLNVIRGIGLVLLVGCGLAARLFCLTCKPFWFDETFSIEVARVSWPDFLHLLWWREANMSLYYVLLRLWLHFGHSPFFIRSLSAVIAAGTIAAVYWLGSLLYSRRVAWIAAALLTFNGYHIRYAQEARSYALFVLLATLSSGFLIAFLRKPTRRNRIAYVAVTVLAVYAHLYALLLIAAHWLALRWIDYPTGTGEEPLDPATAWRSRARDLRSNWKLIALGVTPLLLFVAKTGAGPIRWIRRPGLLDLLRFSINLTDGWPLVYFGACLITLIPVGKKIFQRSQTWQQWRAQFLLIWLMFPIVLTVLLSFARPVFLPRYMIFCIPALVLLTAAGVSSIHPGWLRAGLACAIVIFSARFVPYVYSHDFDDERDASVAASGFVLDHAQPGDAVVFHIAETRIPYEFVRSLRTGQNSASASFNLEAGPEIVFPHHGPGLDYRDFTGKPTAELLTNTLPAHPRVWVILMNNGTPEKPDPTTVMVSHVMPEMFPKEQTWQFPKVEVRRYSKQ